MQYILQKIGGIAHNLIVLSFFNSLYNKKKALKHEFFSYTFICVLYICWCVNYLLSLIHKRELRSRAAEKNSIPYSNDYIKNKINYYHVLFLSLFLFYFLCKRLSTNGRDIKKGLQH